MECFLIVFLKACVSMSRVRQVNITVTFHLYMVSHRREGDTGKRHLALDMCKTHNTCFEYVKWKQCMPLITENVLKNKTAHLNNI